MYVLRLRVFRCALMLMIGAVATLYIPSVGIDVVSEDTYAVQATVGDANRAVSKHKVRLSSFSLFRQLTSLCVAQNLDSDSIFRSGLTGCRSWAT